MIHGIMLAAGLSTRMGAEKVLLPLRDKLVIEQSIETALQVCERLVVVVKEQIRDKFALPEQVTLVVNERPEQGQASSIAAAMAAIDRNDCNGVFFFAGDSPFFDVSAARAISALVEASPNSIVIGRCDGNICHPGCFGSAFFDELAALRGDVGGRQVIRRHPDRVRYYEMDQPRFSDIDTCRDYVRLVIGRKRLAVVRGAGDIATGTIHRLHEAGFAVVALDIAQPTVIRRTVSFAQAVIDGVAQIDGVMAKRCATVGEIAEALMDERVPVLADAEGRWIDTLGPDVVIDAILAKKNLGTARDMAPVVIALGPGFCAGVDCDAVIETQRGHYLGRAIYSGPAASNTGVPGNIGGFTSERVVHAPAAGTIALIHDIGDHVEQGECVALIGDVRVEAPLKGVLRGMIADGMEVDKGLKIADVDPRDEQAYCFSISDKARSVAGGSLEAALHLLDEPKDERSRGGRQEARRKEREEVVLGRDEDARVGSVVNKIEGGSL